MGFLAGDFQDNGTYRTGSWETDISRNKVEKILYNKH